MSCPSRFRLELLADSALDDPEASDLRGHADACESCGAYLRRLDEEAESLRLNLPDVDRPARAPAWNPWKPVALMVAAGFLVVCGILVYTVRRQGQVSDAFLSNLEAQIEYHLEQEEPAKAAAVLDSFPSHAEARRAADRARVRIAKASEPEAAAALLDAIPLSGLDRAQAEEVAGARLDAYLKLFREKVLRNGAVPTPYELAAYRHEKAVGPSREELSRITARLRALVAERRDLAKRYGGKVDGALEGVDSLATVTQYALGEIAFEAVAPVDAESRVQFGDALFRERQFDRAIATWKPVLDDTRVIRRLAELAALRRHAPQGLHVWDYEVEKLLGRDAKVEAEVAARIEGLFQRAQRGSEGRRDVFERKGIPRDDAISPLSGEPTIFFPESTPEKVEDMILSERWIATDPEQLFLLMSHAQFRLEVGADRPFATRTGARLKLHSAYRGPVRFRLCRVRDEETFAALGEENLVQRRAELTTVREWEKAFAPIWLNDMKVESWEMDVPHRGPGLFVLIADARYCPVYAVAKFIVTDVALVQQVASDRVLVFAADRVTGAPVADLPIGGEVTGRHSLRPEEMLPQDDSSREEYKRGFEAAWGGAPPEPDATPSYARGHLRAAVLREAHPDVKMSFHGKTDKDGLFEWMPEPAWKPGYAYSIKTVTAHPETYSRVESTYSLNEKPRALKALVYSDRPLYRPGDTVSFKGLLRTYDDEGIRSYDEREAIFEIGTAGRVHFARSLAATEFGTASGTFALPFGCEQGSYWVRVNNGPSQPLFKVEEYRKPEFEIVLDHPRKVTAGAPVEVEIAVRYFTGDPVANALVTVVLETAPAAFERAPADAVADWYFEAKAGVSTAWRAIESRSLTTDAAGRCLYRFATDEGVAARYAVTARAREESRREISRSSGLEATARALGVSWEGDRPVYHSGERATLRFRALGAATLRLEERGKVEKPFSKSVTLVDGLGSCDYFVQDRSCDLQVGVRSGDGWAWTPVDLRIAPRSARSALVDVRTDRALYRVGDRAKLLVESDEPDQHVLLTVATGRIHWRQVVALNGKSAEVPIEIVDEDVPNVMIVATAIRNDRLGKATARLLVPPVDRFLTVDVDTDRAEYRPGQECRTTVRVTDSKGRPVPECEISLGVVDEAIYSLHEDATPDLREFFHRYQRPIMLTEAFFFKEPPRSFVVWKVPVFVKGTVNVYDTMGVGMGGGGGGRYGGRFGGRENLVARGGGGMAIPPPRSDFRDTAFWNAHLKTDADGRAAVAFAFPENLTSFRFTARGITRDHKVGAVKQNAVVRKPFYARLATSRVVQEGNTLAFSGLVHNYTGQPQTVRCTFKSPFPLRKSTAPPMLSLPPGEVARVEYLVSIDRYVPEAEITFVAASDEGASDGVTLTVPGRRHGLPFQEGRSGSVASGAPREEVFKVPAETIRGTVALRINMDAGVHTAILGGLEGLIEYPHGCVEQTMSRFLPAVAANRALGDAPHRWSQKLPSVVASGLQRLYQFQHADGGWGWWEHDATNGGMTAYVLYGLSACKKAGVGVDRTAADRAAVLLRGRLEKAVFENLSLGHGRVPIPGDPRAYAMLALAEYESAWGLSTAATKRLAGSLADLREPQLPLDEIMLALACERLGMKEEAARLAKRAEALPLNGVPHAALLLQLQAARGGEAGDVLRFLLAHRVGQGWRTTMESAYAILGLSAILDRPAAGGYAAPGRIVIEVNGEAARELTLPGRLDPAFDGRISVPEPPAGWGGKVVVRFTFEGRGTAFYTASLEAMLGGEDGPPVKRGLEISREYFEGGEGGWKPVEGGIAAGKKVLVHLTIRSSEPREYVMVTDPRGDGFEPVDGNVDDYRSRTRVVEGLTDHVDLSEGWLARRVAFQREIRGDAARESAWARELLREIVEKRRFAPRVREENFSPPNAVPAASVEHRDDRTLFFLAELPAGTSHLYYMVRAELSGEVHVLPPQATPMYEPEIHGAGVEARLRVTDELLVGAGVRTFPLAPGVSGLTRVLQALERIDADELIGLIPSSPRIGDLLARVLTEPALRTWLSADSETRAAGSDLRERIEAARHDLATRRLCAEALGSAPKEWLPAIEEAMGSDRLAALVFKGAVAGDAAAIDVALAWAVEDRAFRLELLEEAQRLRGTAQVEAAAFHPVTVADVLRALGPKAPGGDALVRWRLSQRGSIPDLTLGDLAVRLERDLGLKLKLVASPDVSLLPASGRVSEILDRTLLPARLYTRIRDGVLWVGPLDEIVK
jgi:uncharacterized protein YfaS (alpha-2-macroglobulin family)